VSGFRKVCKLGVSEGEMEDKEKFTLNYYEKTKEYILGAYSLGICYCNHEIIEIADKLLNKLSIKTICNLKIGKKAAENLKISELNVLERIVEPYSKIFNVKRILD